VEIQAHGSPVVLGAILDAALAAGARPAEPGEFTRRAFLNGRLSLTQAEAVADLIAAESRAAARIALAQLRGELNRSLAELREPLLELSAELEASIEFPEEEDLAPLSWARMTAVLEELRERVLDLIRRSRERRRFVEGFRVVIAGMPNVGKSSLLNLLLGRPRAIVHPQPGTTRDTIEAEIELQGARIRFVDTAGLREQAEPVEQEGIRRAWQGIAAADLILLVLDRSAPPVEEEARIAAELEPTRAVLVLNKCDLPAARTREAARALLPGAPLVETCALDGSGLAELRKAIASRARLPEEPRVAAGLMVNQRHRARLEAMAAALERALEGAAEQRSPELVADDLRECLQELGAISGETTPEDVLDRSFSRFCIGK